MNCCKIGSKDNNNRSKQVSIVWLILLANILGGEKKELHHLLFGLVVVYLGQSDGCTDKLRAQYMSETESFASW